jgi:hypothetical protein
MPQGLVGRCAAAFAAHARGVMVHAQCVVTTCMARMVARLTVDLAWQGEGEGPEATRGGARQAGCGGDSLVPLVANEGVELKVAAACCSRGGAWSPVVAVVGSSNAEEDKEE